MNPRLQSIQKALRQMGLLRFVDNLRLSARRIRNAGRNRRFVRENPGFVLPPEEIAFDAHGTVDWAEYKRTGEAIAARIATEVQTLKKGAIPCVVEWGCGPGRVIRHLPALLPGTSVIGTDYNPDTIAWCSASIEGVSFRLNGLNPPLPLQDASADVMYAISVITHLSESVSRAWVSELRRVLKPDGLLLLWTNGDKICEYLLPEEQAAYRRGEFVTRDNYEEGKKLFLSFHPPRWVRESLLVGFDVIRHYPGGFWGDAQDVWVCRRRAVE